MQTMSPLDASFRRVEDATGTYSLAGMAGDATELLNFEQGAR